MISTITFLVLGAVAVDADTFKTETPWGTQYFRIWGLDGLERSEPGGPEAKSSMAELIDGQILECEIKGYPTYNRMTAQCFTEEGIDLACEQIKRNHGVEYNHFSNGYYQRCENDS